MKELHHILKSSVMIRRKKQDVLPELPPKTYTVIPLEIDNRSVYEEVEDDFLNYLRREEGESAAERASNAETLTRINYLRRIAAEGKIRTAITWIKETLDIQDKLVIFCNHRIIIDSLMKEFHNIAVKIDGSVLLENRQLAVDRFQEDPKIQLMIANIAAGGVGYTLTAAHSVGIMEYPWTPTILDQAEDRCHRISQKYNVTIYNLIAIGTIEERIIELLNQKRKIVNAILDGKDYEKESILYELLKEYKVKIK